MDHDTDHATGSQDGRRARLARRLGAAAALAVGAAAHAGIVDINGGNSWAGWTRVGDAKTSGVWVRGSTTRNYDLFGTSFTLDAAQTVGGSRLSDGATGNGVGYTGDSQASLFSGSWMAGDRIIGVGLKYAGADRLGTIWVHVDWAGDSIRAASSVGAADGAYTANAGDLSIYSLGGSTSVERFRAKQYSVFNGFTADGGSNYITPYGGTATISSPGRSFAVLASGGTAATSAQYFINLDAIARSNGGATFGEGVLGPATKIGFYEADTNWNFSQQAFSIPAPGAMALVGLAGLCTRDGNARRRR